MVGEKGGIGIVNLCRQCYEEYGKRIGKETLEGITLHA